MSTQYTKDAILQALQRASVHANIDLLLADNARLRAALEQIAGIDALGNQAEWAANVARKALKG